MTNTRELALILKLQDQMSAELRSALKGVEDSTGKTSTSVGGILSKTFSGISDRFSLEFGLISDAAKYAAAGVTVIGGALATAGAFALKSAADFEQNRIAFETLLGSASKAQQLLADITQLAKTTPFQLPDVVSASKQLLAYGIEQKDIISTTKMLGDVSAGLGLQLSDVAYLYGTTRTQGQLYGRDLIQFTTRGIPLVDELAKQFGVSADKVNEMVSAGQVGFPQVQKAFESMTGPGGKFFDLMIKQSTSFSGLLSNLYDSLGIFARGVIGIDTEGNIREGSIFATLKNAAAGLYDYLDKNQEVIRNTVTKYVDEATQKVIAWYQSIGGAEGIKQKLTELWNVLTTQVVPAIITLVGWIVSVTNFIHDHYVAILAAIAVWEAFKIAIATYEVITGVTAAIQALSLAIGGTAGLMGALSSVAAFLLNPWTIAIAVAIAAIVAIVIQFNKLQDTLSENRKWIDQNKASLDKLQERVGTLKTDAANKQLQNAIDQSRAADKALQELTDRYSGLGGVVNAVADQFNDWAKAAGDAISKVWGKLKDFAKDAGTSIGKAFDSFFSGGGIVPGYATGGVVYASGGAFTPRGTDTVPAMLTPGEMVLNSGQQNRLFNMLNGRSGSSSPSITVNVTGNTLLDSNAAEQIGNLIVRRLKLNYQQ